MTINEIKKLCSEYGIKPSKSKGQNFLIDEAVLRQIVKAANLNPKDFVVEVGPGFGILTEELLKNCQRVLSVEVDKSLAFYLKKHFKGRTSFQLLETDILKIKNQELTQKLGSENYKLVANIPYSITKPILQKFLRYEPRPCEITVLIQKEVAEKIVAQNGKLSILSISIQFYGRPEIAALVSKQSFFPEPAVDSAILKIKTYGNTLAPEIQSALSSAEQKSFSESKFWQLVKIGFSSPRKQVQNNLINGLKIDRIYLQKMLETLGLRQDIRAEDIRLADWARLYQQLMV